MREDGKVGSKRTFLPDEGIEKKLCPRREGDPAVLIADSRLATSGLGWYPQFSSLEGIIKSAWQWKQTYPDGYK